MARLPSSTILVYYVNTMALLSVRLDDELDAALEGFGEQHGLSRSEATRVLLGGALGEAPAQRAVQETVSLIYRAQAIGISRVTEMITEQLPDLIQAELVVG